MAIHGLEINEKSTLGGITLYVGGSGPGNYSRIQDAIDDARDGDTVFVYSIVTRYFENLVVDKSINLIGEDRHTTIIDGTRQGTVVNITGNDVRIEGFTIQRGGYNRNAGIKVLKSSSVTITNNIISDNHWRGIWLSNSNLNLITGNDITGCNQGIYMSDDPCIGNVIRNNSILGNDDGMIVRSYCQILNNNISGNLRGISGHRCKRNTIKGNILYGSVKGISFSDARHNVITYNDFLNNEKDVFFQVSSVLQNNLYLGNYWNETINGIKIIPGEFMRTGLKWVNFDWRPSSQPNNL
jgi:parallel beta-helix repeat protein